VSIIFLENGVTLNFFWQAMQDGSTALTHALSWLVMVNPRHITSDNSGYHIMSFIVVVMEREVTTWFRQQPKECYAADFQGLRNDWTSASMYVEK
jgi:hypothetical protein